MFRQKVVKRSFVLSFFSLMTVLLVFLNSCSPDAVGNKRPGQEKKSQATSPGNGSPSAQTPQSIDQEQQTALSENNPPILLFAGWGWNLPGNDHQLLVNRFIEDGLPQNKIHLLTYEYSEKPETVKQELLDKLNQIFQQYDRSTKFDVIGVSTGHFAAIYTIMEANLDQRIRKFIGYAGIAHGINKFEMLVPGLADLLDGTAIGNVVNYFSGETIQAITPYMNPFLQTFYSKYANRISQLDKCSIYSPDDGFIDPYNSGHFDDGKNVELPGLKHLDGIKQDGHYLALKKYCYGITTWQENY